MKRKIDWHEEEESGQEDSTTSDEESDSEEPRIKDVLNELSQAVSRKRASELLHSMATSKDILFWTPRGQLLRNQRIIPVTNISELVEYVLLPHNDDVAKPRALNTFMEGLAELGVNKRLIKNKKVLSDILQKEQVFHDEEENNEADDGNSTDSNEEEETASESSQPEETQETEENDDSDSEEEEADISDSENSTFIKEKVVNPCQHCEGQNVYDTAVMKCTKCFWVDNLKICPICNHKIPLDRKHGEHSLRRCYDCGAITHKNEKTLKVTYYLPSNEENEDDY